MCGRTCEWFRNLSDDDLVELTTARGTDSPLSQILTKEDEDLFTLYCGVGELTEQQKEYGFPNRGAFDSDNKAPRGAFYWWNGEQQLWPNKKYQVCAVHSNLRSLSASTLSCTAA